MTDTNYTRIYTGNFIIVQQVFQRLEKIGIKAIIKDESESGRLAGFGSPIPGQQEVFVHVNELDKAVPIIEQVRFAMNAN